MPQIQPLTDSSAASFDAALPPLLGAPPWFTCARSDGRFGTARVRLTGELDLATAPQLEQTLRKARVEGRRVVLDLRELAFMDCAGMGVIVAAAERARREDARLIVVRGPSHVDRVFTLTGTSAVVEFSDRHPRETPTDRTLPLVALA